MVKAGLAGGGSVGSNEDLCLSLDVVVSMSSANQVQIVEDYNDNL